MRFITSLLLTLAISTGIISYTQNLIPNPGFELHEKCLGLNTPVSNWSMPTGKYYHYLCECPVGKAQYSGEDANTSFQGKGFAGLCLHSREAGEYMMVKLDQKLIAGTTYIFSGNILLAAEKQENYKNFERLEIAFTEKEYSVTNPSFIFFEPQVVIPVSFENKEKEWNYLYGKFTATGNEVYLIIGDFISETPVADQLAEYMTLSPDEREKYLKKHRKLEEAMNELNTEMAKNTKPYSIRIYLDELCLMAASDTTKGLCNYPIKKSIPTLKPEPLKPIVIENIFFETGKSVLLPSSFAALDSLSKWLKKTPLAEIEITGHTDNTGDEKENLILSSERASSVKNYLYAKGVKNKIESNGVGSSKPIASNNLEEGKRENRRVEFTIIKQ